MNNHAFTALLLIVLVGVLTPQQATGQNSTLRTGWGDPDVGGVWDFRTLTPMERPTALADKEILTAEEAAAFEEQSLRERNADRRDGADQSFGFGSDIERAYNDFWWDYGSNITDDRRTSLIVDPPDGRIPWTPA